MFGNALDSGHWPKRKSLEGRCDCILDEDTKEHPSMHCLQNFYQKSGQKWCGCLDFIVILSVKKRRFFSDESEKDIAQMVRCRCWAP